MIDRQQTLTRLHCKLQNILEMQNSHHTSSTSHTLHHTSSTPVLKLLSSKNVQTCLYTLFKKQQSWYIFGSVSHRCSRVQLYNNEHFSFNSSFKPAVGFGEPKLLNHHEETFLRCNDLCSLALTSSSLCQSLALLSTSPSRFQEPCCNA